MGGGMRALSRFHADATSMRLAYHQLVADDCRIKPT